MALLSTWRLTQRFSHSLNKKATLVTDKDSESPPRTASFHVFESGLINDSCVGAAAAGWSSHGALTADWKLTELLAGDTEHSRPSADMCIMYRWVNGWCRLTLSHTHTHTHRNTQRYSQCVCVGGHTFSQVESLRRPQPRRDACQPPLLCVSCSNSGFYRVSLWLWGSCRFTEVCREQTVTWQHAQLRGMLKYRCNPQHNTPNMCVCCWGHTGETNSGRRGGALPTCRLIQIILIKVGQIL